MRHRDGVPPATAPGRRRRAPGTGRGGRDRPKVSGPRRSSGAGAREVRRRSASTPGATARSPSSYDCRSSAARARQRGPAPPRWRVRLHAGEAEPRRRRGGEPAPGPARAGPVRGGAPPAARLPTLRPRGRGGTPNLHPRSGGGDDDVVVGEVTPPGWNARGTRPADPSARPGCGWATRPSGPLPRRGTASSVSAKNAEVVRLHAIFEALPRSSACL
jgi:hypothetical protein